MKKRVKFNYADRKNLRLIFTILMVLMIAAVNWKPAQAYTTYGLDWDLVDYPSMANPQTFTNVANSGVDMTFSVTVANGTLSGLVDNYTFSPTTPHVQSLVERIDLTNTSGPATMVVKFSHPVSNVNFSMHDIDRDLIFDFWGYFYYFGHIDRLVFSAYRADGITVVNPVFSNLGKCVRAVGAVIDAGGSNKEDPDCNGDGNNTKVYGDAQVSFPGEITQFQFSISNTTNIPDWNQANNPSIQSVGIGDISFDARWDYGDLPASYPSAARNYMPASQNLYLGSVAPDDELSAAVSNDALGDGSDEDAFSTFPGIGVAATSFTLTVPLVNNSGHTAQLNGWIDFNMDGVFTADEYQSVSVANGQTSADLVWNNLPVLTAGGTFARLRLSSNNNGLGTATSDGSLSDGEVEDYAVSIQSATAITLSSFSASSQLPWYLTASLAGMGLLLLIFWQKNKAKVGLAG